MKPSFVFLAACALSNAACQGGQGDGPVDSMINRLVGYLRSIQKE